MNMAESNGFKRYVLLLRRLNGISRKTVHVAKVVRIFIKVIVSPLALSRMPLYRVKHFNERESVVAQRFRPC